MKRISNEDGLEASRRNFGRLALSAIPWVLGMGSSVWFGVYLGLHQFRREISQEQRAAVAVGAQARPKGKIAFDFTAAQTYCAGITRGDVEGATMRLYAFNDCHKPLTGMDWHYEMLSANGTVLHAGKTNQFSHVSCPTPTQPGDSAECVFGNQNYYSTEIPIDDRVVTMRVWTIPYSK